MRRGHIQVVQSPPAAATPLTGGGKAGIAGAADGARAVATLDAGAVAAVGSRAGAAAGAGGGAAAEATVGPTARETTDATVGAAARGAAAVALCTCTRAVTCRSSTIHDTPCPTGFKMLSLLNFVNHDSMEAKSWE